MAATGASTALQCSVLTPDGAVFEGEVRSVAAPGSDGELGVYRGHAPLVTALGFGSLRLKTEEKTEEWFLVGGFMEVLRNKVAVLARRIERLDEIDVEEARERVQNPGESDDDEFDAGRMARKRLELVERFQKEQRGY